MSPYVVPFPGLLQGGSWFVLFWLAMSCIGLVFKALNVRAAARLLGLTRGCGEPALIMAAVANLTGSLIMAMVLIVAALAGMVAAVGTTPPPPRFGEAAVRGEAVLLSLEVMVTAIAMHAVLTWWARWLTRRRVIRDGV